MNKKLLIFPLLLSSLALHAMDERLAHQPKNEGLRSLELPNPIDTDDIQHPFSAAPVSSDEEDDYVFTAKEESDSENDSDPDLNARIAAKTKLNFMMIMGAARGSVEDPKEYLRNFQQRQRSLEDDVRKQKKRDAKAEADSTIETRYHTNMDRGFMTLMMGIFGPRELQEQAEKDFQALNTAISRDGKELRERKNQKNEKN